jgi:hypothetical protein
LSQRVRGPAPRSIRHAVPHGEAVAVDRPLLQHAVANLATLRPKSNPAGRRMHEDDRQGGVLVVSSNLPRSIVWRSRSTSWESPSTLDLVMNAERRSEGASNPPRAPDRLRTEPRFEISVADRTRVGRGPALGAGGCSRVSTRFRGYRPESRVNSALSASCSRWGESPRRANDDDARRL